MRNAALADAGPAENPVVTGLQERGQVGIGQHRRRQAFAPSRDCRVSHGGEDRRPARLSPWRDPPPRLQAMTDHNFHRWRPHPWHGLDLGDDSPRIVNAYIEITPFDVI